MKYKLTDSDGYTRKGEDNETLWGENVTHKASGSGRELCTSGVIHWYKSPEEAAFFNPIHANITNPVCWEGFGVKVAWDGCKGGSKVFTTIRRVPIPIITTEHRVEIAIRASLLVYHKPSYVKWANNWLSGKDRSAASAAWSAVSAESAASAASAASAGNKINIRTIICKVVGANTKQKG